MRSVFDELGFETGADTEDKGSVKNKGNINNAWYFGFNQDDDWDERHWWKLFKDQESISLGYHGVDRDISGCEDADEIKKEFNVSGNIANQLERFVIEAQEGDVIFVKDGMRGRGDEQWVGNGKVIAIGVISGNYVHEPAEKWYDDLPEQCEGSQNLHHRGVEWIIDLEATTQGSFTPDYKIQQGTIFPAEYQELKSRILVSYGLEDQFEQLKKRSVELTDKVQGESQPTIWIEKSKHDSEYKQVDKWGLGEVIWCPQTKKDGSKSVYYENIKKVEVGDIILHLDQGDREFTSASLAADTYDETTCPEDSEWNKDGIQEMGLKRGERPAYKLNLKEYQELDDPLDVDMILNKGNKEILDKLRSEENVVYNKNLNLNQGAYLTRAPSPLVTLISECRVSEHGGTHQETPDAPEQSAEIERQLIEKKQVVFYGPPGTGKTYTAERFAKWWVGQQETGDAVDDRIDIVTFHPSFTYEDFVEGLSAKTDDDGQVAYDVEDGVLKRIRDAATTAYEAATANGTESPRYVLIIDEINRGNLAQIFGEMITLLEADKRGAFTVDLAHSGETVTLPPNLYVIGTMNTADQSIALVDTALRRRFRFIDFPPDLDLVWSVENNVAADAYAAVTERDDGISRREQLLGASVLATRKLNDRILHTPELGKGKQIGHTYLLGHASVTAIVDAWRYDILPQLEEYYFGQFDRLRDQLLTETGELLIQWDEQQIRSFTPQDLYTALCNVAGIENPAPLATPTIEARTDDSDGQLESVDAWDAGEKTVDAFRERAERTLDLEAYQRVKRLLSVGEEVGWLDSGRGEKNATAQLKTERVDPGVGPLQIGQDGTIEFKWDWLAKRDENNLTGGFIDQAAAVFHEIEGYTHEWHPEAEEGNIFNTPNLQIQELSDQEFDRLIDGFRSFVEDADEFQDG